MLFEIYPTDKFFTNSPSVENKDCICSRCGNGIPADRPSVFRAWPDEPGDLGYDPNIPGCTEYRYCASCCERAGINMNELENQAAGIAYPVFFADGNPMAPPVAEEGICPLCGCAPFDADHCQNQTTVPCLLIEPGLFPILSTESEPE